MGAREATWLARGGWSNGHDAAHGRRGENAVVCEPFAERRMRLEAPGYFKTESPDALK